MYLKDRLAAGHCLVGAGIYSNSPEVIEYAARGMDWVCWEAQHTHPDWQTLVHGVRAAYGMRMPVLVRTWTHDCGTVERLLDSGAEGLIVPLVNTPEQAQEIVSHCYFPPIGERSFGSVRVERIEEDLDEWNRRIVTVMMIETPEAVQNAEAIAEVEGVDALLVGHRDLALRLGDVADEYTAHQRIGDELQRVIKACRKAGKAASAIALTPEMLVARIQEGYRLILAGWDLDHLEADYRRMREAFRKALQQTNVPH
ncbi:MAG: HpcH/HpaI aldolase family protein [bacterium]